MAEFYNLWKSKDVVVQELEALIQDAEENEGLERHSAQKIQQVFRGQTVRSYVTAQRLAASCISRIFRGHMGRRDAAKANRGKMRKERMAVFHYHALLVQKYFRGFYSRRYYHDFFARKAYIQSVVVKSNALREKLATQLERQRREEEDKKAAENHEEFKKVTQNLHHLVSTTATPGIYKSPYMQDQVLRMNVPLCPPMFTLFVCYVDSYSVWHSNRGASVPWCERHSTHKANETIDHQKGCLHKAG
jgi:hypothetical protein